MKTRGWRDLSGLLPAILAAATTMAVDTTAGPRPPRLRLGDDVTPRAYRVDLTIDPAGDGFEGSVEVDVEVGERVATIWLHADAIAIDEARVVPAGGAAHEARPDTAHAPFLGLELATPIDPGPATIHLRYHGRFETIDSRGIFKQREGDDWYVFTQFEATDARRAFPCFDEPGFKVPWRISLEVPAALVAVANTPATGEERERPGFKRIRFAPTPPLPSYLVAFAIGPFDIVDAGRHGMRHTPIRILTPHGLGSQAAYAAEITPLLVERLERYFATPYPYAKLDEVAIPETVSFGAMENAGLITYSQTGLLVRPSDLSISARRRLAGTTAHELAHQWFGNLVTLRYWDDTWLNEGFASWMGGKIVREWKPQWGGAASRVRRRGWAMSSDSLATARKIRQPIVEHDDIEDAFDGISYMKGSMVLEMFESWLGEDRFRTAIRSYLAQHAWGNATSDDLLAALAASGGDEVRTAFRSFLDQPGLPLLHAELRCPEQASAEVRLTQDRFLPAGSKGSRDQLWALPACLRYGRGDLSRRHCEMLTTEARTITLDPAVGCPEWLLGNDGAAGYYRVAYAGDGLARLLAGAPEHLDLAETIATLDDVDALADAGTIPLGDAIALAAPFAGHPSRHLATTVAGMVASMDPLVGESLRPAYASFVRRLFGARAASLGLEPRAGEDQDTRLLRSTLVGLVADQGADRAMRAEAHRLTLAWIDDPTAIDRDMVSTVLEIAAAFGDPELFDRLLAKARVERDRRRRRRLLLALGDFRDPALTKRALDLFLGDDFPSRTTRRLLSSLLSRRETRPIAWSWLEANFDAWIERSPRSSLAGLPRVLARFCDPDQAPPVERFFRAHLGDLPGAKRSLRQAIERKDLCIARRRLQRPGVTALLEREARRQHAAVGGGRGNTVAGGGS